MAAMEDAEDTAIRIENKRGGVRVQRFFFSFSDSGEGGAGRLKVQRFCMPHCSIKRNIVL